MKAYFLASLLLLSGCGHIGTRMASDIQSSPSTASAAKPFWPMEGGGPGRASYSLLQLPSELDRSSILQIVKNRSYYPEEYSMPIIMDGIAYLGCSDRRFVAFDLNKNEMLWEVSLPGRVYATAAYSDSTLVFGDDSGEFRALGLDGKELWNFKALYPIVASPLVSNERAVIAVSNNTLFSLDLKTGEPVWKYERKFPARNSIWRASAPAQGEKKVFAGFSDGAVVALDAKLGKVLWTSEIGAHALLGDVSAGPTYKDGRLYVGTLKGPTICFDAKTGNELWRSQKPVLSGFAVGDELIYAGTPDGAVIAMAAATGKPEWETMLDGGVPTNPTLSGDRLVVGASAGSLHLLDSRSGEIIDKYFPGQGLHSQPLIYEDGLVFLSDGGKLHLFKREKKWDSAEN